MLMVVLSSFKQNFVGIFWGKRSPNLKNKRYMTSSVKKCDVTDNYE